MARWFLRAVCATPLLFGVAASPGGTAPPLLERVLTARGPAVRGIMLRAEAKAYAGVPGRWRFTRAHLAPDRYAWRIETAGAPDSYLFDGDVVRAFIGSAQVASDASPNAPLRSHERWTALMLLDGLEAPGVAVTELATAELPGGIREGLRVTYPDGGTYRLGFDERARLVWAAGPLDLWPLGHGPASVRYGDHRRTGGVVLPFHATYFGGGKRLAEESIVEVCIDPPALRARSFVDPAELPFCRDGRARLGDPSAAVDP
jgi:hypothetical protein